MQDTKFYKQAELLLQILPFLKRGNTFALKGGTALNFFIRDLPRLSVDIDLTYLPIKDRDASFLDISTHLKESAEWIISNLNDVQVHYKYAQNSETVIGFVLLRNNITVKVEPNLVIRGAVYKPEELTLCRKAQDMFGLSLSFVLLSKEDLYGGKICAALDRQHPRDLYDIKLLLENENINEKIRKAFIVYLCSHSRPMVELLNPNLIDIKKTFENEFYGMTFHPVNLDELLDTRKKLIRLIKSDLSEKERRFILSVKLSEPEWELLEIDHIEALPAVNWKLQNIRQMNPKKHKQAVNKLKDYLEL